MSRNYILIEKFFEIPKPFLTRKALSPKSTTEPFFSFSFHLADGTTDTAICTIIPSPMLMAPALVTSFIILCSGALVTVDEAVKLALGKALSAVLTSGFLLSSHKYHPSFL